MVERSALFQRMTDPVTKFVPVTVSVNGAPPAIAADGLRLVSVGTGLDALIVKV